MRSISQSVKGKAEIDPVPSLRGALKQAAKGHHAAITPDELPEFIRAFEKIEGLMYVPYPRYVPPDDAHIC